MKSLFFVLTTFGCLASLIAQSPIDGTVVDEEGQLLPGALIRSLDDGNVSTSDDKGWFSIPLEATQQKLVISLIGHIADTVEVNGDTGPPLVIVLPVDPSLLDEILVVALRADERTPVTYSNITAEDLATRNQGQDMPILLNYMPSVVTTSDAGAGIGYTGIRVRGSDATRVNVTINGIPYNDSESQGTFWVNMPDFSSSVESVQLQRGVGTSSNGSGAFGASLNILTEGRETRASGSIANSFGSFNTRKHTVEYNTGLINEHVSLSGRLSQIKSDGYIDRASSDLQSYFLQGNYVAGRTVIKALAFGGREETYQAWYGVDSTTLADDRTANFAGYYVDQAGNERYHDQQVDHYNQDHYQLHLHHAFDDKLSLNLAGHYTYGRGYYEEYIDEGVLAEHGIVQSDTLLPEFADLIRRKWLDNDFYGFTASLNYSDDAWRVNLGGAMHIYEGDHFGEVIWARYAGDSENNDRYYDNYGNKDEVNGYLKIERKLSERLFAFADLQLRTVGYEALLEGNLEVNEDYTFFNPKAGLSFSLGKGWLYASIARAQREPNRTDFENGTPTPEVLDDIELGWRGALNKGAASINFFHMMYQDQLVLTGNVDDVGNPIRDNVGRSLRSGVEVVIDYPLSKAISWRPNLTLSRNVNLDYQVDNADGNFEMKNTDIAFSPELVIGNALSYRPWKDVEFSLLSKHVSEQYMGNTENKESLLSAYTVNDLSLSYVVRPSTVIRELRFDVLVNNLFDERYESNGYWFPGYAAYYPQAGINFLAGISAHF